MNTCRKQKNSLFAGVTGQQNREFGLVAILVVAVLAWWLEDMKLLPEIIILVLTTILFPVLFTPFTALWYMFARVVGRIMSSFLLGLVFFLMVTPVGCIRRLCGKDSLSLRQFGNSRKSVFVTRDHTYSKDDMIHMF